MIQKGDIAFSKGRQSLRRKLPSHNLWSYLEAFFTYFLPNMDDFSKFLTAVKSLLFSTLQSIFCLFLRKITLRYAPDPKFAYNNFVFSRFLVQSKNIYAKSSQIPVLYPSIEKKGSTKYQDIRAFEKNIRSETLKTKIRILQNILFWRLF